MRAFVPPRTAPVRGDLDIGERMIRRQHRTPPSTFLSAHGPQAANHGFAIVEGDCSQRRRSLSVQDDWSFFVRAPAVRCVDPITGDADRAGVRPRPHRRLRMRDIQGRRRMSLNLVDEVEDMIPPIRIFLLPWPADTRESYICGVRPGSGTTKAWS
jgi:hypothetical protein